MALADELKEFIVLIEERCGISYKKNDVRHLRSAIEERMVDNGVCDLHIYFNHVFNEYEEFHHLIEILTINETYFFREVKQLDFLCGRIISKMLIDFDSKRKIRILSIGCSDGSEVYSIVMKIIENFGEAALERMEFMAGDIDRKILKKAQNGLYGKNSFRTSDETYRKLYFEKKGLIYELSKTVRDRVGFYQVNLLSDAYPDEIKNVDVIFYRNVSIYFENNNQHRVFQKLSKLLNKGGSLFLSSTETHQHHQMNVLGIREEEGLFYFKKEKSSGKKNHYSFKRTNDSSSPKKTPRPVISLDDVKLRIKAREKASNKKTQPLVESGNMPDIKGALASAIDKDYRSAIEKIELILEKSPDFPDALTLKAAILLNLKKTDEARTVIARAININSLNIEGIILLGVIEKYAANISESIKHFRSAMFLSPTVWFIHLNLAELFKLSGRNKDALKEYSLAKNLLLKHGLKNTGLTFFPFSFKSEQLIKLFDTNIDMLLEDDFVMEKLA